MKKITLIITIIAAAFTSFAQKSKMNKIDTTSAIVLKYRCPMHPDFISDKPGKCPKCGSVLGISKKEQFMLK